MAATPSISPALIGVGYIIGFELSAINCAGGLLAWFVLVPFALFLNPGLGQQLAGAQGEPPLTELVFSVWYNQIRPIAVGAMLVGAARTMWGMQDSIGQALRGAFHRGSTAEPLRTEKDLPARAVLAGIVALSLPVFLIYYHFSQSAVGAAVAAVVMMVTGFLFSAVGGYLVGPGNGPSSTNMCATCLRRGKWRDLQFVQNLHILPVYSTSEIVHHFSSKCELCTSDSYFLPQVGLAIPEKWLMWISCHCIAGFVVS